MARGLRFQGPAHSKPSIREERIVYKAFPGIAVFIGENDSLFFWRFSLILKSETSWRHAASKPCGTFWVLAIIRGLPTFFKKEIITVLQKQIFPSFISPSKPVHILPWWMIFLFFLRCQEYFSQKVAATSLDDGWHGKKAQRGTEGQGHKRAHNRISQFLQETSHLVWSEQILKQMCL